jgi:hypothetical protein
MTSSKQLVGPQLPRRWENVGRSTLAGVCSGMIDEFVQTLWSERATAILRASNTDVARQAMEAAIEGGFRILEFTLTTPNALGLIEEFASRPGLIVGAGTVLSPDQAKAAALAGARFLVSPIVDEAVIRRAHELGVAAMPGTHTPTEMVQAHRAGAPLRREATPICERPSRHFRFYAWSPPTEWTSTMRRTGCEPALGE